MRSHEGGHRSTSEETDVTYLKPLTSFWGFTVYVKTPSWGPRLCRENGLGPFIRSRRSAGTHLLNARASTMTETDERLTP